MRKFFVVSCLVLVLGLAGLVMYGCGTGGGGGSSPVVLQPWLYFGNDVANKIFFVGPDSETISGTIELPASPRRIAASPDGTKLYVTNDSNDDHVFVVSTQTNTITDLITIDAASSSRAVALSPDGNFLYLAPESDSFLYRVNVENKVYDKGNMGGVVRSFALNSDGTKILRCNGQHLALLDATTPFSVRSIDIDLGTNNTVNTIAVKDDIAYAPVNRTGPGPSLCYIINLSEETFSVITGEGYSYYGSVVIPGKDKVYISQMLDPGKIRIIDTTVPTFEEAVLTDTDLYYPDHMAATKDGKYVVVMDGILGHTKIGYIDTDVPTIEGYIDIPESTFNRNNPVIIYK